MTDSRARLGPQSSVGLAWCLAPNTVACSPTQLGWVVRLSPGS